MLARILQEYPQDVRVVYRHFPLMSIHDKAALATQAAEAAGKQGKFWEMHDILFAKQSDWKDQTAEQFQAWLAQTATGLGLDQGRFTQDLNSQELVAVAQDAWDKGRNAGLPGTPSLLINNAPYNGPLSYGSFKSVIDAILLEKRQFNQCPPMTIDPSKQYFATLKTDKGDIVLQLLPDKAPMAVNSFVFLAQQGWFNNVTFHRVLPGFVAQGGDPSGSGFGGPGYAFDNEVVADLKFDGPGVVGMANAGPGTNGSQFFITLAAAPNLDGQYTVFGKVVSGIEVVQSLTERDPSKGDELPPGDKILSVTIETK